MVAGVPKTVIQRAKQKLHELEQSSHRPSDQMAPTLQPSSFDATECEAVLALKALDPDALTPRQALDALYRLRQLL